MKVFKATEESFHTINRGDTTARCYPYFRNPCGSQKIYSISPLHGRSFVVGRTDNGRFVVSKGNGLCYSKHSFLHTGEFGCGTWGLLLRQDAERDFILGREIEKLGIKTNSMEYVLELDMDVRLPNGHKITPTLLQYDVECPYRISDAAFMTREQIQIEVKKWESMNKRRFRKAHMIAASVMIGNLKVLHDHNILHNAIHEQNYTWALELLDFELACSPKHPYNSEDDMRHMTDLFPREILQTYVIIDYIAGVLKENVDYSEVDGLFAENGFVLNDYIVHSENIKF